MTITLKYFGSLADITDLKEEQLTFDEETILVSDIKSKIELEHPGFQNATYSVAVNQTISGLQTAIKNHDEIAFLPPFAGG